jgi:hypothetical protein
LARFFSKEDHSFRISAELRSSVVFTVQDVLADPPFARLDFISCRNLLIYLRPEAQAKVLSVFHFALREDGLLLVGNAETVSVSDGRFAVISQSDASIAGLGAVGLGISACRRALAMPRKLACVSERGRRLCGAAASTPISVEQWCWKLMVVARC